MSQSRFDEAVTDVSKVFREPREILEAADLSQEQKAALLKQWDMDLRLLMVASEENMAGTDTGRTAELLQAVEQALIRLGVEKKEEKRPPTKTGGA